MLTSVASQLAPTVNPRFSAFGEVTRPWLRSLALSLLLCHLQYGPNTCLKLLEVLS